MEFGKVKNNRGQREYILIYWAFGPGFVVVLAFL